MDDNQKEINLGAEVCARVKRLRYSNTTWIECKDNVAIDFTTIKRRARDIYPGEHILKILANIRSWSDTDLVDVFE